MNRIEQSNKLASLNRSIATIIGLLKYTAAKNTRLRIRVSRSKLS